jgi:hypothetical protein
MNKIQIDCFKCFNTCGCAQLSDCFVSELPWKLEGGEK